MFVYLGGPDPAVEIATGEFTSKALASLLPTFHCGEHSWGTFFRYRPKLCYCPALNWRRKEHSRAGVHWRELSRNFLRLSPRPRPFEWWRQGHWTSNPERDRMDSRSNSRFWYDYELKTQDINEFLKLAGLTKNHRKILTTEFSQIAVYICLR